MPMKNDKWIKHEQQKIKRQIQWYGENYTIFRFITDERGENTDSVEKVSEIKALYHEQKGFIRESIDDSGSTKEKRVTVQCMLLTLPEYVKNIKDGDVFKYNNNSYKISNITNVGNLDMVYEISLQEVDGNVKWDNP